VGQVVNLRPIVYRPGERSSPALAIKRPRKPGPRRKPARGFTLLEMIVATLIMAVAVVGLLGGISGAARNAARVRDYDRIVQLARLRMNDLLLDPALTANGALSGTFNPAVSGGLEAGWQARASTFEMPPNPAPNLAALERVELQVWWMSGLQRRTFNLEAFRERLLKSGDLATGASQ
jgi:general secretion pathway protein I